MSVLENFLDIALLLKSGRFHVQNTVMLPQRVEILRVKKMLRVLSCDGEMNPI